MLDHIIYSYALLLGLSLARSMQTAVQIANYILLTANPIMVLEISLIGLAVSEKNVICYLQFNTCTWTEDQQCTLVVMTAMVWKLDR